MNYELAKKLKDAGFPQEGPDFGFLRQEQTGEMLYAYCFNRAFEVRSPSLSTLIEACGDEFVALSKTTSKKWAAHKRISETLMESGLEYSTPEEAVANLWLTLNEK